jgi:hypothetical protein
MTPKDKNRTGSEEFRNSVKTLQEQCKEASKHLNSIFNISPLSPEQEEEMFSQHMKGMSAVFIRTPPKKKPGKK